MTSETQACGEEQPCDREEEKIPFLLLALVSPSNIPLLFHEPSSVLLTLGCRDVFKAGS